MSGGGKRRCWRCLTLVNKVSVRRAGKGWECRSRSRCLQRLATDLKKRSVAA